MRRRWLFAAALLVAASCGTTDPLARRMKARLDTLLGHQAEKQPSPDEMREALVRELKAAPPPAENRPTPAAVVPSAQTLQDFYAQHGYRPIWIEASGAISQRAKTVMNVLRQAGDQGLSPEDYGVKRLEGMAHASQEGDAEARAVRLADFDLLATSSFLRYAADVSTGRVHPDEVRSDWHTNPPEVDVVQALEKAISGNNVAGVLASLPPPHPGYERLRQALPKLREIAASGGWPPVPPGPALGPRSTGPRVDALRRRLGLAGHDGERFDKDLASAVRRFQTLYGIEPSGKVDDKTLEALNVSVDDRIRQIELNLERWRWIPRGLGDPHVLVNIPGDDLMLERSNAPMWRTRVVTGKAYSPTPVFSDRIVAIVVHPAWNVPESIAGNEYLAKLRSNPAALAEKGFRIVEGSGNSARELSPMAVNWSHVEADNFRYQLQQKPGKDNPLGNVKFVLTNDLHIYLHDTPSDSAFARSNRSLSHGCIRVENAEQLMDLITSDAVRAKIEDAMTQPKQRRIELDTPVPVHILYWTAWVDDAGNLHFAPDVYGFDAPQQEALGKLAG